MYIILPLKIYVHLVYPSCLFLPRLCKKYLTLIPPFWSLSPANFFYLSYHLILTYQDMFVCLFYLSPLLSFMPITLFDIYSVEWFLKSVKSMLPYMQREKWENIWVNKYWKVNLFIKFKLKHKCKNRWNIKLPGHTRRDLQHTSGLGRWKWEVWLSRVREERRMGRSSFREMYFIWKVIHSF